MKQAAAIDPSERAELRPAPSSNVVRIAPPPRSDDEIVAALKRREPWAAAALLERYGSMVERVIRRILGHDPDLRDLVQDSFTTILASIAQVRDGAAVK